MLKVSVLIITYNQDKFVAQALDSVLMQHVDFEYEIILSDDCSTDNTREILQAYHRQYPDRIKLLLNEQNLGMHENFMQAFRHCQGQYIALLEGDDYWTHQDKLNQQVEFLDNHIDCSICFHNALCMSESSSWEPFNYCDNNLSGILTIRDLFERNIVPTASVMFRAAIKIEIPIWTTRFRILDWLLHLLYAQQGNIGYMDQVMSVYRIHQAGVWNSQGPVSQNQEIIRFLQTVNIHFDYAYDSEIAKSLRSYQERLISAIQLPLQQQIHEMEHHHNESVHHLNVEVDSLNTQLHYSNEQIHQLNQQLHQANQTAFELKTELYQVEAKLNQTCQELESCNIQVRDTNIDRQVLLFRIQRLRTSKERLQDDLNAANDRISAMETSKFWKLRKGWFKFKRAIGRGDNE